MKKLLKVIGALIAAVILIEAVTYVATSWIIPLLKG